MKRNFIYGLFLALGAMAMSACSVDNVDEGNISGGPKTLGISAVLPQTRTQLNDHQISWAEGDKYAIFASNGTGENLGYYSVAYDETSITVPGAATILYAVYPDSESYGDDTSISSVAVAIAENQDNYDAASHIMYASADIEGSRAVLTFKPLLSVVEFNIYDRQGNGSDYLSQISVKSQSNAISGGFTADLTAGTLAAGQPAGQTAAVTVSGSDNLIGTSKDDSAKAYIILPKGEYAVDVEVYTNGSTAAPAKTFNFGTTAGSNDLKVSADGFAININLSHGAEVESPADFELTITEVTYNKVSFSVKMNDTGLSYVYGAFRDSDLVQEETEESEDGEESKTYEKIYTVDEWIAKQVSNTNSIYVQSFDGSFSLEGLIDDSEYHLWVVAVNVSGGDDENKTVRVANGHTAVIEDFTTVLYPNAKIYAVDYDEEKLTWKQEDGKYVYTESQISTGRMKVDSSTGGYNLKFAVVSNIEWEIKGDTEDFDFDLEAYDDATIVTATINEDSDAKNGDSRIIYIDAKEASEEYERQELTIYIADSTPFVAFTQSSYASITLDSTGKDMKNSSNLFGIQASNNGKEYAMWFIFTDNGDGTYSTEGADWLSLAIVGGDGSNTGGIETWTLRTSATANKEKSRKAAIVFVTYDVAQHYRDGGLNFLSSDGKIPAGYTENEDYIISRVTQLGEISDVDPNELTFTFDISSYWWSNGTMWRIDVPVTITPSAAGVAFAYGWVRAKSGQDAEQTLNDSNIYEGSSTYSAQDTATEAKSATCAWANGGGEELIFWAAALDGSKLAKVSYQEYTTEYNPNEGNGGGDSETTFAFNFEQTDVDEFILTVTADPSDTKFIAYFADQEDITTAGGTVTDYLRSKGYKKPGDYALYGQYSTGTATANNYLAKDGHTYIGIVLPVVQDDFFDDVYDTPILSDPWVFGTPSTDTAPFSFNWTLSGSDLTCTVTPAAADAQYAAFIVNKTELDSAGSAVDLFDQLWLFGYTPGDTPSNGDWYLHTGTYTLDKSDFQGYSSFSAGNDYQVIIVPVKDGKYDTAIVSEPYLF